jgi:hypothetical protein
VWEVGAKDLGGEVKGKVDPQRKNKKYYKGN